MDIVDRMIEWLNTQPDPRGRTFHRLHPETLMVEALIEIERLREALREYACDCETKCHHGMPADMCGWPVRVALGEEK